MSCELAPWNTTLCSPYALGDFTPTSMLDGKKKTRKTMSEHSSIMQISLACKYQCQNKINSFPRCK